MVTAQGQRRGRHRRSAAGTGALGIALVALGCADILGLQDRRSEGPHCSSNDECAPLRSCFEGKCRDGCASENDCPKGSTCLPTTMGGACVIGGDLRCGNPGATCPSGTRCLYDSVCVADCNAGKCFEGQVCRDGVCIDLESEAGGVSSGGAGGFGDGGGVGGTGGGGKIDGCAAMLRDCTSSADNDCDGKPDNTMDGICQCVVGQQQMCGTHPGYDGKGPCKPGARTCVASSDKAVSYYGPCVDSVAPATTDSCTTKGDDANCNGVPNEGCCFALTPCAGGIDAGTSHFCALKKDRSIACWGSNDQNQARPPLEMFSSVSAGEVHSCAVKTNGSVLCWGDNSYGQASPPAGTFSSVSAGGLHTCGVSTGGSVVCWGDNSFGEANPPTGAFLSVSAGGLHTCGIKTSGSVVCWGDNTNGRAAPPIGAFVSVSASETHTCGVKTSGAVACWGDNGFGEATPPAGTFSSVSAGNYYTCGLRPGGSVVCWGANNQGEGTPPASAFSAVSAGFGQTCGVKTDGTIACWGTGGASPPIGTYWPCGCSN